MTEEPCPRCHEPLPADVCYEALPLVPGHLPAYRLRHKRMSGQTCIVYAGGPVHAVKVRGVSALPIQYAPGGSGSGMRRTG